MTIVAILIPLFMPVAAPAPAPSLTAGQRHALAHDFICPADQPDDQARIMAIRRFVARYGAFAPRSTMGERMAFWDHLLESRHCAEMDPGLSHEFPQS